MGKASNKGSARKTITKRTAGGVPLRLLDVTWGTGPAARSVPGQRIIDALAYLYPPETWNGRDWDDADDVARVVEGLGRAAELIRDTLPAHAIGCDELARITGALGEATGDYAARVLARRRAEDLAEAMVQRQTEKGGA